MAIDKGTATNIDKSDLANYPNGRIKDNDGTGDGTAVNRQIYSDFHEYFAKLMRLAGIAYSGLPDNEGTGYQLVDAAIALAGKNDFITALNTIVVPIVGVNTNVISVPLILSKLKVNEALICQAMFDLTDQTKIKGTEAALQTVTFGGNFKNGDYIRFIKTNTGVTLIRLADDLNLDVLVTELLYLKATTSADEFTGTSQTAATTPYTNQLAFARRVIGTDSSIFLASASRNGLLSAAQWSIINAIPANPVKNIGWFSGFDPGLGPTGLTLPTSGNMTSATVTANVGSGPGNYYSTVRVVFANAMANLNFFARIMVESQGSASNDSTCRLPLFVPVSTTAVDIIIGESVSITQSLKVHLEIVQIS